MRIASAGSPSLTLASSASLSLPSPGLCSAEGGHKLVKRHYGSGSVKAIETEGTTHDGYGRLWPLPERPMHTSSITLKAHEWLQVHGNARPDSDFLGKLEG